MELLSLKKHVLQVSFFGQRIMAATLDQPCTNGGNHGHHYRKMGRNPGNSKKGT